MAKLPSKPKAIILGSGYIGSTVALCAKAAGYDVQIITDQRISLSRAGANPRFASGYPAASILPHSVAANDMGELMAYSQTMFKALENTGDAGVRSQRHFELWEAPLAKEPNYLSSLRNAGGLEEFPEFALPKRKGAENIYGYGFNIFFADMPCYGEWLNGQVDKQGIEVIEQNLMPNNVADLKADIIFNCLGIGAARVFPELSPGFVVQGMLLQFACDDLYVERNTGQPVSLNYIPQQEIYPAPDGSTWDVYFYPRQKSIILGGTRQVMTINPATGKVSGDTYTGETIKVEGIDIPRPMLDLNRELIRQMTGRELPEIYEPLVGYRHIYGTPENPELRIAARHTSHVPIIDCLGFGGSGVTLSWGAGIRALATAQSLAGTPINNFKAELQTKLLALLTGTDQKPAMPAVKSRPTQLLSCIL